MVKTVEVGKPQVKAALKHLDSLEEILDEAWVRGSWTDDLDGLRRENGEINLREANRRDGVHVTNKAAEYARCLVQGIRDVGGPAEALVGCILTECQGGSVKPIDGTEDPCCAYEVDYEDMSYDDSVLTGFNDDEYTNFPEVRKLIKKGRKKLNDLLKTK